MAHVAFRPFEAALTDVAEMFSLVANLLLLVSLPVYAVLQDSADTARAVRIVWFLEGLAVALILAVCMGVSLPLGLGAAMALAEFTHAERGLGHALRRLLDVLAAVPSIVFGLFGNAVFAVHLGLGFSIASGGLTLACMVLPILIRTTESAFAAVPEEIRLGAAALGLSHRRRLLSLLLPVALPGLMAGFALGLGRAIAETAALVFTSGYVDRMPGSLLDSGRALSVHIYDLAANISGGEVRAFASAAVLVVILLLLNAGALWLARRWQRRHLMME